MNVMAESITLEELYKEIKRMESKMVSEFQRLNDTFEILGNPETMKQISQSNGDIQQGKVKDVHPSRSGKAI